MSNYVKKIEDLDREHLLYSVTFFSTHGKKNERNGAESLQQTVKLLF